jgi:hypothetical protein
LEDAPIVPQRSRSSIVVSHSLPQLSQALLCPSQPALGAPRLQAQLRVHSGSNSTRPGVSLHGELTAGTVQKFQGHQTLHSASPLSVPNTPLCQVWCKYWEPASKFQASLRSPCKNVPDKNFKYLVCCLPGSPPCSNSQHRAACRGLLRGANHVLQRVLFPQSFPDHWAGWSFSPGRAASFPLTPYDSGKQRHEKMIWSGQT